MHWDQFHLPLRTLYSRKHYSKEETNGQKVESWETITNVTLTVCLTQWPGLEDSSAGKHVFTERYIAFQNYSSTKPGLPQ